MMKFLETHFDDYTSSNNKCSLHPKLNKLYEGFPTKVENLKNLIFYGPKGIGKYTQALSCIKRYSNSELKYEKRLTINSSKESCIIKMSDIHFEVDMSLLGCNSKILWNDIYNQINDVVSTRANMHGIILCKYFHKIHSELLDIFYSYMQSQSLNTIKIIFIIITENISFIPDNIINNAQIISVPRPKISNYNKCFSKKMETNEQLKSANISNISNIKNVITHISSLTNPHECICNAIIENIKNPDKIEFLTFRDILYDILIYELDINECIWYILRALVRDNVISEANMSNILLKTNIFLQYYNNNYRPIYHLENYMYNLITIVNGYKKSAEGP